MANGIQSLLGPDRPLSTRELYEQRQRELGNKRKTREQVAKIWEALSRHKRIIDTDPEAVGTGSENLLDSLGALMGGNPLVVAQKGLGHIIPEYGDGPSGQFFARDPENELSTFDKDTANPDEDHYSVVLRSARKLGRNMDQFEGPPSSWSWGDRALAMHEFGHGMDQRNILSPELEYALSRVPGDFYDRRMFNLDRTSRTRNPGEKVGDAVHRAWGYIHGPRAARSQKKATQFQKAFEPLQIALDPDRQFEARAMVNTPELKMLVGELLKHEVYQDHPWNVTGAMEASLER
tara:strand:+ start:1226 stop:2101 length:876 start_codon:yes stop_codon:yes gene_type:complete